MIKNHQQVIELWPDKKVFSDEMNEDYQSCYKWFQRNYIPAAYWVRLVAAAHNRDFPITYKLLAETCQKKSPEINRA